MTGEKHVHPQRIQTDCRCCLLFQSTIFTGGSGYIIAALWVIGGILYAGFLLVSKIFFTKRNERYGVIDNFLEKYHLLSVILLILLAAFAM
jgi:hypothetical protein